MTTNNPIKYPLVSFLVIGQLPEHQELKQQVLTAIDQSKSDSLIAMDSYYTDTINKLDWNQAKNFSKPWAQILKPKIDDYLNTLAVNLGYQSAIVEEFWFQQYVNGNTHGWHTHGSNFTGVYYLEFDADSPKTEIIEPIDQTRKITPEVKEGDIMIFPSYTIHRAPLITNNVRKTIVSFNFILDLINPRLLDYINSL